MYRNILNYYFPDDLNKLEFLKENNIDPDVDSRLKFYNTRLDELYIDSHDWNRKIIRDTFNINTYTLKFVSKHREKEYNNILTESNLGFYRFLIIIKAMHTVVDFVYYLANLKHDLNSQSLVILLVFPEILMAIFTFTKFFKR